MKEIAHEVAMKRKKDGYTWYIHLSLLPETLHSSNLFTPFVTFADFHLQVLMS